MIVMMMNYLISTTENIVDVEFYYEVIENEGGYSLILREKSRGHTINAGFFETRQEAEVKAEEIKDKILKLAAYEKSLDIF